MGSDGKGFCEGEVRINTRREGKLEWWNVRLCRLIRFACTSVNAGSDFVKLSAFKVFDFLSIHSATMETLKEQIDIVQAIIFTAQSGQGTCYEVSR
jgi:hypothetical protein